jgi:hypothetical protein
VKVRSCYSLNNRGSGIIVTAGAGATSNDVAQIDLGADAALDPGGNTVQAAFGGNNNGNAGICLSLPPNVGSTLRANGNIFEGNDCSRPLPPAISISHVCSNGVDIGVPAGDFILTANCAQR